MARWKRLALPTLKPPRLAGLQRTFARLATLPLCLVRRISDPTTPLRRPNKLSRFVCTGERCDTTLNFVVGDGGAVGWSVKVTNGFLLPSLLF